MAIENKSEGYNNGVLADFITDQLIPELPEQDVSERTYRTRTIGAFMILRHLAGGDWGSMNDFKKDVFQEFITRVVANGERQGIIQAEHDQAQEAEVSDTLE